MPPKVIFGGNRGILTPQIVLRGFRGRLTSPEARAAVSTENSKIFDVLSAKKSRSRSDMPVRRIRGANRIQHTKMHLWACGQRWGGSGDVFRPKNPYLP